MHLLKLCLLASIGAATAAQTPRYAFDGDQGDLLGVAVGSAGDVDGDGRDDLLVGAPNDDDGGADAGSVRVYSGRDGTMLYSVAGGAPADWFGGAVAPAGDVDGDGRGDWIAGAAGHDTAASNAGRAAVYSGDGSLLFAITGTATDDYLGFAVAGAGDVDDDGYDDVIVGAPGADAAGVDSGEARVHSGRDGSLLFVFAGTGANDRFGYAVTGTGDLDGDGYDDVAVGAPGGDQGGDDAGYVTVFGGRDGAVLFIRYGDDSGDAFGSSVGGAGGDLDGDGTPDFAVGAPGADRAGANAGGATVFSGRDGTVVRLLDGEQPGDTFGFAVRGAGDVDGDGVPDVIVGAPEAGSAENGCVTVWSGADGSLLVRFDGTAPGDALGWSVATAGATDGDGFADLIVGAPRAQPNGPRSGTARVFALRPQAPHAVEILHTEGAAGAEFGADVRAVGDVDLDGVGDYVIGAPFDLLLGTARVYSGADHSVLHTFLGPGIDIFFGAKVGPAGDIDRDGHADIIVGALHDDTVAQESGMARVYSGADGRVLHQFFGSQFRSHMGTAVGSPGDVDGDGTPDLFVGLGIHNSDIGAASGVSGDTGAKLYEVNGVVAGEWFGWSGDALGDLDGDGVGDFAIGAPSGVITPTPGNGYVAVLSGVDGELIFRFNGLASRDRFGWELANAGDVDADGTLDLIVGADGHDPGGRMDAGHARVLSGADGSVLHDFFGLVAGDFFGKAVAGAGDVDGDGHADLLVGAPGADANGDIDVGAAFLFSGRDGRVLQTFTGAAPLDALGESVAGLGDLGGDGRDDFAVGATLADTAGANAGEVTIYESADRADPGSLRRFGAGCAGSDGRLPRLVLSGRPVLGLSLAVALRTALPGRNAGLGLDATPQGFALGTVGAPGCTLLVTPLVILSATSDARGRAQFDFSVPVNPDLVGRTLFAQWWIDDPTTNPLGLSFSDGGRIQVGAP